MGPSESGWSSGKSPFPWSVVMTGAMSSSASAANGWAASAILTPPPPQSMGLSALTIIAAARSMSWGSTGTLGLYALTLTLSGKVISASSCCTSLGRSSSTGPGLPVVAR